MFFYHKTEHILRKIHIYSPDNHYKSALKPNQLLQMTTFMGSINVGNLTSFYVTLHPYFK